MRVKQVSPGLDRETERETDRERENNGSVAAISAWPVNVDFL